MTVHRRRPFVAIAVCLSLVGSAALVVARTPGARRSGARCARGPCGTRCGPRGAPQGPGRGRSMVNVQEYPANPNDVIQAMPGFKVEVVAKADRLKQGSWISMTEDDQGRIILGANEQQPFTRLTLDKAGKVVKNETIFTPVSEAMGVTWHDDSLYVQGGKLEKPFTETMEFPGFGTQSGKAGLYRLRDPKGDGSRSPTSPRCARGTDPRAGTATTASTRRACRRTASTSTSSTATAWSSPKTSRPIRRCATRRDDRIIPLLGTQTGPARPGTSAGGTHRPHGFRGQGLPALRRPASATRSTSTGMPTVRSSRSTATWSRSSACRGIGRCACSGRRAARTWAIAATAASTRPTTRTHCRRSSTSDSAVRSA